MFIKNVTLVAAGTAMAQAITLLLTPLITRLYGPEAFGVLGLFTSIITIAAPISAFCYPIAIVLPQKDSEALSIAKLSIIMAATTSIITLIVLAICGNWLSTVLGIEKIGYYLYLLPLCMFFAAVFSVLSQWVIRKGLYAIKSKAVVYNSILLNLVKISIGFINPGSAVLVGVATLNNISHVGILAIALRDINGRIILKAGNKRNYIEILKKYADFFVYRTPQVFFNALSQSIPVIILTSFFSISAAGYYSLARLALAAPTTLIGEAVSSVFYPKFNQEFRDNSNPIELFVKSTVILGLIGVVPFGLIIVYGPYIFSFIFGNEWEVAGEYAQWLSVWLLLGFANRPSVAAIPVLSMQRFFLIYEIMSIVVRTGALLIGAYIYKDALLTIALFSISGALLNTYLISTVLFNLKSRQNVKSNYT